ncbi:uncharacterized protein LOC118565068 isoform X2 [Fundulus heteroclitus]|uniref:uncharacterized protein LOC118565068 isoform X2 n=1 Tax=Fundulus heteroclitus TaxID=8078 RepID=UPI00165A1467|nr:uncharacterized protein LOC118565068 isoform X2 [Fundulus heteroclitus]
MEAVRSLCRQCGIDPKGSRLDLIIRLQTEKKNCASYNKPELMRPKTPPQPQMRAKILPWPQIKYQTLERQRLQYLVDYVLNAKRSETEIIGTIGTTNLTWQDFQSLGLQHNLEATIANSCMELICDMARWKKKDVYAADAYVVATWHAPSFQDPFLNLPADAASKDLLIFPVWKPGHWFLCDDMPWLRRWWRHSMLANITLAANANDTALACNVLLAEEPARSLLSFLAKFNVWGTYIPRNSLNRAP